MASSSNTTNNSADLIQGLNLIHPPAPSNLPGASSDADLLAAGPYSDLASLDLWTNVHFAPDEPFVPSQDANPDDADVGGGTGGKKDSLPGEIMKKKREIAGRKMQLLQAHLQQPRTSTGTGVFPFQQPSMSTPPAYDLSGMLNAAAGSQFPAQAMNINQLLALQAFPNPFQGAFGLPFAPPPPPQVAFPPPTTPPTSTPTSTKSDGTSSKRSSTKSRKNSNSTTPVRAMTASSEGAESATSQDDPSQSPIDDPSRLPSTSEDKRRRNTQASARFRLKKKEREHAMEIRSKELETKVSELEKECEALRRENGWLKGLVVGVTGGTGMSMTLPTGPVLNALPAPPASGSGSKRRRMDDSA